MDVKEKLKNIADIFDKITDPEVRVSVVSLLNLVEKLANDYAEQRKQIQNLKDEVNRLKKEQGKPKINPQKKDGDVSSEQERKNREPKKSKKPKKKKKNKIKPDRTVFCVVDKNLLPPDAKPKGYETVVIQDLKVITDHVEFRREIYHSASLNKSFMADLPKGYEGEFGPGVKALVVSLYHESNMTQPAIKRHLNTFGISIAKATISRMLTDRHEVFHQEKEDIIDAGLKGPYQQTDDTSARENGKNRYVHILCNPFYTAYFTRLKKDRMTLIGILCRGEQRFLFNDKSYELMRVFELPESRIEQLKALRLEDAISKKQIDVILSDLFPNPKKHKANRRHILEASALAYFQSLPHAPKFMLCDDAQKFNFIFEHKSLCWIHEGRHYKKLSPFVPVHQEKREEFLSIFWDFYRDFLAYTRQPTDAVSIKLEKEFDRIFSMKTGYEALDKRIELTGAKKEELLCPLRFPFLPLHNNESENGAQHQARLRDIHRQTRNEKGTKAKDTFATIVKTARKLGVNLFDYFYDRISGSFSMTSLGDLILERCGILPNPP